MFIPWALGEFIEALVTKFKKRIDQEYFIVSMIGQFVKKSRRAKDLEVKARSYHYIYLLSAFFFIKMITYSI